jgi:hypothetical protein
MKIIIYVLIIIISILTKIKSKIKKTEIHAINYRSFNFNENNTLQFNNNIKIKINNNNTRYKKFMNIVEKLNEEQDKYLDIKIGPAHVTGAEKKQRSYYSLNSLLINEEYKFLFCPINHVSSTLFRQLFMRMDNNSFWFDKKHHTKRSGLKKVFHFHKYKLHQIFNDKTWTKAIFFRNPLTRLRSSYNLFYAKNITTNHFRIRRNINHTLTWKEFLNKVSIFNLFNFSIILFNFNIYI